MDEELWREFDWINDNLIAIATNQALIYEEMKEIEDKLLQREEEREE